MPRHWRAWAPALLAALLFSLPAAALRSDRDQPINIVADTSEVDAKTGYTRITGGVIITQGSLVVHADEARVYVNEGKVNRVELDGAPATWEQQLENGEDMNARARHIDYRVPAGIIELTGNALVNHPQGEISGASLQYELDTEKLRGFSQKTPGGDRVRIRIEPDAVDSGGLLDGVGSRPGVKIDTPPADNGQENDGQSNDGQSNGQSNGQSDSQGGDQNNGQNNTDQNSREGDEDEDDNNGNSGDNPGPHRQRPNGAVS